jgi:hypothetical protein
LGYDTTTPIQPEGLERQKDFFEAERTQYTERTDKTIKFQKRLVRPGKLPINGGSNANLHLPMTPYYTEIPKPATAW